MKMLKIIVYRFNNVLAFFLALIAPNFAKNGLILIVYEFLIMVLFPNWFCISILSI